MSQPHFFAIFEHKRIIKSTQRRVLKINLIVQYSSYEINLINFKHQLLPFCYHLKLSSQKLAPSNFWQIKKPLKNQGFRRFY